MRFYFSLSLPLLLLACDGGQDPQSGMVANIENATPPDMEETPANNAAPTENAVSAAEEESEGLIPVAVRGRWTGIGDNCTDKAAELELSITPRTLIFHESVGTVNAIEKQADGRLKVDASFTGEGQSWTRSLILKTSAKGEELTVINDGAAVTRKRCG